MHDYVFLVKQTISQRIENHLSYSANALMFNVDMIWIYNYYCFENDINENDKS